MHISYNTRKVLQRVGIIALIALIVLSIAYFFWFLYLGRYVVYTRSEGAVLNMELDPYIPEGEVAVPPEAQTVTIYYNEGENAINVSRELTPLVGYYADEELLADMALVKQQVSLLSTGTPVMLEVKDAKGRFFYNSTVSSERRSSIDAAAMDELIKTLDKKGMYLIAKLPALRDYSFGLRQTDNGLFVSSGAYLWADDDYCYWLDPTKQGTVTYLVEIVSELKKLGFDEVVFDDYRFPDTDNIKFSGDRTQALNETAMTLATTCADQSFTVSFVGQHITLPGDRSRIYLKDVAAAQAGAVATGFGFEEPAIHVVFLTENHDTRYDDYSVLRPLDSAG
ncbi:MAG: hypothetical protein IKU07_05110 [Oscillospiraceae bacterium]|nr:hypothetical protein [Oscillospiraceae bacterium]